MRTHHILLAVALVAACVAPAQAACKQKRSRDPSFIELTVPEGAIRPAGPQDFAFVDDSTSYEQLVAKAGPPDASQGTRMSYFIWCFADGSELTVSTRDQVVIEQIRHDGKLLYKRGKKN